MRPKLPSKDRTVRSAAHFEWLSNKPRKFIVSSIASKLILILQTDVLINRYTEVSSLNLYKHAFVGNTLRNTLVMSKNNGHCNY